MSAEPALRIRPGVFLGSAAVMAVLMLAIVVIPQTLSRQARLEVLRDHVGEVARLAASQVDGDLHRRLIEGEESDPAVRAEALAPLLRLHRAWPEAIYVYTMGHRDGQAFFVLDTAQDEAFASLRGLRASDYLEPFRLRAEYQSDWLQQIDAGRTFVNEEFQHDDYGYFLTGHAPIRDSDGGIAGFVGVDFDLDYWLSEEARFQRIEVTSIAAAVALSLLVGFFYSRYHYVQQQRVREHYETSIRDSLTGLPNRRGALQAIQQALLKPATRSHAALLVDIDHFKTINDTHGHAAGDTVIQALAGVLRACVRPGDVTARLGGDEFLVFAADCDLREACSLADRLLASVRTAPQAAQSVPFAVSIGLSVVPASEASFDLLYRRADIALYQAKEAGKNRYALYDPIQPRTT